MDRRDDALSPFHPLIRKWFSERMGSPTDIQTQAWPVIAAGGHALVTAPTGSGKTLTAFLWAINQLISGAWGAGQTRVLYVSPLKALNNDIRRNLTAPLEELDAVFRAAGEGFPGLRVLTRSGDTPTDERRRMGRRPPEILITTPESLNILLASRQGRAMLTGVATVILDEIHAVVGTKRGTHLITAVERLARLSGEFQRLALSATVKPPVAVAAFVGGFRLRGDPRNPRYEKREVTVVRSRQKKRAEVRVVFPAGAGEEPAEGSRWPLLAESFRQVVREGRSTLLFANSRRTVEKVTRLINEGEPVELAYAHHGSLSREIRLAVEQRLKNGELKAIVATSSLELGIDIGELDRVILIATPPSIAAAIQRIGRSGHGVGSTSRGLLYPTHGQDFLSAAVCARGMARQDIEPIRPVECPLDVLAQVIVAMTAVEMWSIDELFAFLRGCAPYRRLSRRQFDLVLEMLSGRYADTRIRELKPRVFRDRIDNTVRGREGTPRLLYLSGGTIPDRGYFDLRVEETLSKIGELDEEFVWERRVGDTFTLGTQVWRIRRVTHNSVEVVPVEARTGGVPFWRAEGMNRDFHFAERILLLLEALNDRLDDPTLPAELRRDYFLDEAAAGELIGHLRRQREATRADLPHRRHLLIEHFDDPLNSADRKQVILHTLWGGRINRPFALALRAAWEEKYRYHLEVFPTDDCILLLLPHAFSAADLSGLVTAENIERLLRRTLETTGFFGARFRENAGRALLLPRADFRRRLPLWLNRLRAKKLLDAVLPYPDFPLLLETWRTCFKDEFDLENLGRLLDELHAGQIRVTETRTAAASPFAGGLIWRQINTHMYEDDTPVSGKPSGLSGELLREVLFSGRLRPRIPAALAASLRLKLQRTAPGYAPRSAEDLLDWVKERIFIPQDEWQELTAAIERDGEIAPAEALAPLAGKIAAIRLPGTSADGVCSLEQLGRIGAAFYGDPGGIAARDLLTGAPLAGMAVRPGTTVGRVRPGRGTPEESPLPEIILQWLSFCGPIRIAALGETLGLSPAVLDGILAGLAEAQEVIVDFLTEQAPEVEVCERENLETLLRTMRRHRRPAFQPLAIDCLPLFLAAWQGLAAPGGREEDLPARLDRLLGYPATADAWEKEILPARLASYRTAWLDSLLQTSGLVWFGCGTGRIGFAFPDDLELFRDRPDAAGEAAAAAGQGKPDKIAALLPGTVGRYSLLEIARHAASDSRAVTEKLWNLAWQGLVTNDSFATIRQGVLTDFAPADLRTERRQRPSRSAYNRWAATRPLTGNWYAIIDQGDERDPIDEAELVKDRARQLLGRYGILFREILANELAPLQWGRIFRALRLMELSGEILSGYFFVGVPGVQFISPEAFRFLQQPLPEDALFWLNAADPASLCGIRLEALKGGLPSRLPSTHLIYRGKSPALISYRNGASLEFLTAADAPRLPDVLAFCTALLTRQFSPRKRILVERINGAPAADSQYAKPLQAFGFTKYPQGLELVRKY